jgi:formate--tetrahydrofolate ligase
MKLFTRNIIVCLNKFSTDTEEEIQFIKNFVENNNVEFSISSSFENGGKGAIDLAQKIQAICENEIDFKMLYEDDLSINEKIEKICKNIYHASNINYEENVQNKIKKLTSLGYSKLPICIAKTQYSISDDEKKLGYPINTTVTVRDVKVSSGAGFIVVFMGKILTMPGLPKKPAYLNMNIDSNGKIVGLY